MLELILTFNTRTDIQNQKSEQVAVLSMSSLTFDIIARESTGRFVHESNFYFSYQQFKTLSDSQTI